MLLLVAIPLFAGEIHDAVNRNDIKTVKTILRKNPKLVNERDERGRTPLHHSAWNINYDITKYLLKRGADINAVDSEEYSAIHKCFSWDSAMVVLLLKNGAKITLDSPRGRSLLIDIAADFWSLHTKPYPPSAKMIEQLLNSKNDVTARSKIMSTPLHTAVHVCNYEIAKKLIEHGADINAQDSSGATPLNYFRDKKYYNIPWGIDATCGVSTARDVAMDRMRTDGEKLPQLLLSHGAEYKTER